MSKEFPFVEIPDELLPVIGELRGNTRIYYTKGSADGLAEWYQAISSVFPNLVSPGGVSMFAPVTRAAVNKRIREGRLTSFSYYSEESMKGLFFNLKESRKTPFVYIPVSECIAWAKEIEERMIRLGKISKVELEGEKPDWMGKFWQWKNTQRK